MSISDHTYGLLAPVTTPIVRAFVRVRPAVDLVAIGSVAAVGNAADDTVTSEGRCPR
jgi:hypothetical protein